MPARVRDDLCLTIYSVQLGSPSPSAKHLGAQGAPTAVTQSSSHPGSTHGRSICESLIYTVHTNCEGGLNWRGGILWCQGYSGSDVLAGRDYCGCQFATKSSRKLLGSLIPIQGKRARSLFLGHISCISVHLPRLQGLRGTNPSRSATASVQPSSFPNCTVVFRTVRLPAYIRGSHPVDYEAVSCICLEEYRQDLQSSAGGRHPQRGSEATAYEQTSAQE